MSSENLIERLGLLSEFARHHKFGRTAIMKLCFFLQESKGVPLGYNFSLYSYGPFDSDVLADISTAERLNVLKSNVLFYPSGIGYEYDRGRDADTVTGLASNFLATYRDDIGWVLASFGRKTAGELELLSTILFIAKFHNPKNVESLIDQVEVVKPRFNRDQIKRGFNDLVNLDVLLAGPA